MTRLFILIIILLCSSSKALAEIKAPSIPCIFSLAIEDDAPPKRSTKNLFKDFLPAATTLQSEEALSTLIDDTKAQLIKLAQSEGYYRAHVQATTETNQNKQRATTFHLQLNQPYIITSFTIISDIHDITWSNYDIFPIKVGNIFRAADVIESKKLLAEKIEAHYCLHYIHVTHTAIINHQQKQVSLKLTLEKSPSANFGHITYHGLKKTKHSFIDKNLPFKQGGCYKPSLIEKARHRLLKTNLFAHISVETAPSPNKDHQIPVGFTFKERLFRSLRGALQGSSDEGIGAKLGWEHRNFSGKADKLSTSTFFSKFNRSIEGSYILPMFLHPEQTLSLQSKYEREESDAYDATHVTNSAKIERQLTEAWSGGIATSLKHTLEKDEGIRNRFSLVNLTFFSKHDTRDNKLNPYRGHVLEGSVSPTYDVLGDKTNYLKTILSGSYYYHIPIKFDPVLAARLTAGSIIGDNNKDIPASERFYAGGAGSVRGYEYKSLGNQEGGGAVGGRSLATSSTELRLAFNDSFGGAAFIDGGNVYSKPTPDFTKRFHWAAGLGIRYFTSFAPIRFDIAFPIDKRQGLDKTLQFYISIGQSF